MRPRIRSRAEQAFLFAGKKNKADGTARLQSGGPDRPQRVHDQSGIAAVVERSSAEFPRIQVRTEDNELVGLLAAFDFTDHVGGLDRSTDLVGDAQIGPCRMTRGQKAADALAI